MEPQERWESSSQMSKDVDVTQSVGQISTNPPGAQSLHRASQDQRPPRLTTTDWDLQELGGASLQLEFQDSHLSPALSLLPSNSGVQHNFTEYSLFHQSDLEFAPLRASPDISVASERFHLPPQDRTSQASEQGSLSQHPLAQATVLSEDGASSCCSLSHHSLSPGEEGRQGEEVHSPAVDNRQGTYYVEGTGTKERDGQTLTVPLEKQVVEASEEDTFFLSEDVSAQHLMDLLQKDVGMPSGSSSAVSSASETSLKRTASFGGVSKSADVSKSNIDGSTGRREGPPGEASPSLQQMQQPQHTNRSLPRLSEVSNITIGSRSTQPDNSSEALHRELLCEAGRHSRSETGSKALQHGSQTPDYESLMVHPTETSQGKQSMARTNVAGSSGMAPRFSGGYSVDRGHRERDLWSSGNQTGIDGSYLGFLPQSQSTPSVVNAPPKSSVKAPLGRLSAIESTMEDSHRSSARVSPQPAEAVADLEAVNLDVHHHLGTAMPHQEDTASGKVQALPSLNYMQKVDAWRANQSSGGISLFDSLALQGFSGMPPKRRAYDAVSDSLNFILTQQRKTQQPPVASATNQNVTQKSSVAQSGSSSPRRGEAVGSAPSDKDDTGSAARPSASPLGRSQSHSSLSTVVTSIQRAQPTERLAEDERSQTQDEVPQHPSATVHPSPLMSLGRFSDVSPDGDMSGTLSSSQDSYNSAQNLGASIGASSVISLEVDNYAPHWSSKPSTPLPLPKPQELNIEERIPLYLQNLGIDQSPSTILTPFAPRGPIREPEFSPTDLCTIKGSIGTPTKSTQPSEGGSPQKGEFSRSSLLSVDSSMSIPLSVDSLFPAVSFPEQTRASPSSDTAASQRNQRTAPSSQAQEVSHLPAPQPSQQEESSFISSQSTIHLGDKFESDSSLTRCRDGDLVPSLHASHSMEKSTEDSFVGTKALQEIRKLLDQAENIVSGVSSLASSSSSAASRLHSDEDIFLSLRRKSGRLQDSSFTSSSAGGPRTGSSLLWARSSSDSMLASDRLKESSISQETMTSSGQLDYPSTQALSTAPATNTYIRPQNVMVSGGAGSSLLLSKSARRAEPEGCSAAPPDNTGPVQPPVIKPPPAVNKPPPPSSPREPAAVPEREEVGTTQDGPVQSSSSSPILGDPEEAVMSDGSSDSSLAVRVAKLLQSESPATMVSSTPSTTDQEESRAREWIKLKVSGQQCEPLELDVEDRKRIEEIKRELLFKNPIMSQGSTDTESSAVSSVRGLGVQPPTQPAETLAALRPAAERPAHQQLQSLDAAVFDSTAQRLIPLRPDLEAQVREIAAREGVTLPRANTPALTSITISTCRRSTSPSPSASPAPPLSPASEPLHLDQLSTGADRQLTPTLEEDDRAASTPRESASVSETKSSPYTRDQNLLVSQAVPGNQERQDAIGGQYDRPLPSYQGLERQDVKVRDSNTQVSWSRDLQGVDSAFRRVDQGTDHLPLSSRYSSVSAGHEAEQATGASAVDFPTRTGHVSHLHLTLSPKALDHSLATGIQSSHAAALPGLQSKDFALLRHSSSPTSSPDEGLGSFSPLESYETRESVRAQAPERPDASMLFKTTVPQGRMTSTSPQCFTPSPHRAAASLRPLAIQTPAVPVLLPYKPHGSEELFYVPQTEAEVSPTSRSDTTMESSHTGSDDAVPPRFSSEVLGNRDPGLDRGVTIKHTEGIYSKRLKTASFRMQEPAHTDPSVAADGRSQISVSQTPHASSQVSAASPRVPLSRNQGPSTSKRDQGTSPVQFLSYNQSDVSGETFQPVHVEMGHSQRPKIHLDQVGTTRERGRRDPDLAQSVSQQRGSSLDQLWHRFSEKWSLEESRPTNRKEASLLERLERLSRLIHSTAGASNLTEQEDEAYRRQNTTEEELRRGGDAALKRKEGKENIEERSVRGDVREMRGQADRKVRGGREVGGKPPVPRQAWAQDPQEEETPHPAEEDSSVSHSSISHSQHLCPAERDESDTVSTASGSMSTVDTARLVRAFGAHRVRHLKTGSGLSKLYSTIDKQREDREQRRGRGKNKEPPHIATPSETTGTDDSMTAADSASSTSLYSLPSHRGASQSLAVKKSVKLVSRGIQAGDLEIVSNGTRRHTRDVGTTFPSPAEARAPRQLSSSSSNVERGRGVERSPSKTQSSLKPRKSKRSHPKFYPQAISWFISAEELRAEARKENQPEEEEGEQVWRPSTAWFEPYSRTHPWREPLRQRHVQDHRNKQLGVVQAESDPETRSKTSSSGLVRISLQEALQMRRPEFISESRQRMRRLALQVQERRLQAEFSGEREELFNRTGRLPRPAGTTLLRRAVPRKEMIQRSKQIYENLPEVQRRREEERRKAEYSSYRLNAQLYNKKITSRVLGRRTPWQ